MATLKQHDSGVFLAFNCSEFHINPSEEGCVTCHSIAQLLCAVYKILKNKTKCQCSWARLFHLLEASIFMISPWLALWRGASQPTELCALKRWGRLPNRDLNLLKRVQTSVLNSEPEKYLFRENVFRYWEFVASVRTIFFKL